MLVEHRLFYFPYASLTNAQLPLLKVAALYFDKLILLDPVAASFDAIGVDDHARDAVKMLADAQLLEVVTPADVLAKYDGPIRDAVARDLADPGFLQLCEDQASVTGKRRWTLSLAKVPKQLATDQTMRELMGDFARAVARDSVQHSGAPSEYQEYAEIGQAYDETRGAQEYRYADFPLAIGESIMMNHALFAGLLHASATPITDDRFHSRVLAHKLERATHEPAVRQFLADRDAERAVKSGAFAASALTDTQLKLPILSPEIPLAEVLEYRETKPEALLRARETLALMGREIEAEPFTADFARKIETTTIPALIKQLAEATKARDAWIETAKAKSWFKGAAAATAAASAVLAVLAAPVTPIALAAFGLSIAGVALPGAEWLHEWSTGRKTVKENGLHYLLSV